MTQRTQEVLPALLLVDEEGVVRQSSREAARWVGEGSQGKLLKGLRGGSELARLLASGARSGLCWLGEPRQPVQVTAEPPGVGGWASLILVPASQGDDTRAIIDTMMAGFAHEVRNPLAAILSLTEATVSQLEEQAPARGMLERIPGLVRRVDKLIKQSLSYSRPREPQREATELEPLVGWAVELAQMKKRAGVEFRQELTEAHAGVLVDSEQIKQVLVNLLCNARDAARTRVSLEGKIVGERVILEVSDDGPGIDEQHRARIFEPFFTTKRHGTGLGLPIAWNLARLNGGDLELARTSPWGSTFRLYLTRAEGATRAA